LATKRKFDLYQKMLHEPDAAKQRVLMREFEKRVVDTEAHEFPMLWWYRIIPYRLYVKGWKISRGSVRSVVGIEGGVVSGC
jgi:peptide/nickel transport system substrate-binding protein